MNLKDAVAIVTGSPSGIGQVTACPRRRWEEVAHSIITVLNQTEHVRIARLLVVPSAQPI